MSRMCFAATFRTPDQPAYGPGLRFRAAMPTDTVNHGCRPGNAQKLPAAVPSDGVKFRCEHAEMSLLLSLGRPAGQDYSTQDYIKS